MRKRKIITAIAGAFLGGAMMAAGLAQVLDGGGGNSAAATAATAPAASSTTLLASSGSSSSVRIGESVLAIGNPFDLTGTLTEGIVSGLDRRPQDSGSTLSGLIQTDAAVNPGNSGGPLLNARGEVIGINTLLENPTGQNVNVGIAFAIPINTATQELSSLING